MGQTFRVKLRPHGPAGAWTFLDVPFNVAEVFGTKARVAVCGTINGFLFRNSLMPNGNGTHSMMVNKNLQAGARAGPGDIVSVVMEVDNQKRTVKVPKELIAAFATDRPAARIFKTLSPSHRKEFAEWVGGAKQQSTRRSRAIKSLALIRTRAHTR